MFSCKEAAQTIGGEDHGRLPLRSRIGLRLHLFLCRHCRRFVRDVETLGHLVRKHFAEEHADRAVLDRLEARILKHLRPSL